MRKFLSLLLTMAMVLSLAVTVNAAAPKEDITILHTNDVHCDYEKYAKVATLHKSADLLVDAGDHVQGGVIGTLSKGEYIVDIMNYLKYDAAVPGNHEFDYGMDQFLHIAKDLAKYPYISANFTGKDGKPYFDAYKIFEVKGVKVAFSGYNCPPYPGVFLRNITPPVLRRRSFFQGKPRNVILEQRKKSHFIDICDCFLYRMKTLRVIPFYSIHNPFACFVTHCLLPFSMLFRFPRICYCL